MEKNAVYRYANVKRRVYMTVEGLPSSAPVSAPVVPSPSSAGCSVSAIAVEREAQNESPSLE